MKMPLANHNPLVCITHWSLHFIRVKDFWVNSVGRNAASVTKRSNRSQICLLGNVSEIVFNFFSQSHRRGDYSFIKLNQKTFKVALLWTTEKKVQISPKQFLIVYSIKVFYVFTEALDCIEWEAKKNKHFTVRLWKNVIALVFDGNVWCNRITAGSEKLSWQLHP